MAIVYDQLLNWPFETVEASYTEKDTILYALGVGFGADPIDEGQLRFIFEERELAALPTMAAVLGKPGFWLRDPATGVNWKKVVHGEQGIELHKPLPTAGTILAQTRVTEIIDKGIGRSALICTQRELSDKVTGESLATLSSTTIARSDGGFGGPSVPQPQPHALPERNPDTSCNLPTVSQAALIYRLSGDLNPLHADPIIAQEAGFDAPILHGLCTLGVAGHALLKTYCDYDSARFKAINVRFSAPVYPGETIQKDMWRDGGVISFRSTVPERDVIVLNNGRAEIDL